MINSDLIAELGLPNHLTERIYRDPVLNIIRLLAAETGVEQ